VTIQWTQSGFDKAFGEYSLDEFSFSFVGGADVGAVILKFKDKKPAAAQGRQIRQPLEAWRTLIFRTTAMPTYSICPKCSAPIGIPWTSPRLKMRTKRGTNDPKNVIGNPEITGVRSNTILYGLEPCHPTGPLRSDWNSLFISHFRYPAEFHSRF
jgi:hypothetical protein